MGIQCCKSTDDQTDSVLRQKLLACIPSYALGTRSCDRSRLAMCRLSDFKYQEKIGCGRFGKVYRVLERRTSKVLAIKEVNKKHEIYCLEPQLEKEHLIMSKLKSCWLVDMIQFYETPTKWCMVLEFLPGPSLVYVAKRRTTSPLLVKIYAAEMLMAVYAVHSHGYIHRDIKLANFLLDHVFPMDGEIDTAPLQKTLAARFSLVREQQFQPCIPHGTCYYCAPEVIRLATNKPCRSVYSYLCDYWSLGVCFYYIFFNKLPFYTDEKVQVPRLIINWPRTLRFPKSKQTHQAAISLIKGLLREESNRLGRRGIHEVACHQYFNNVDWKSLNAMNILHWADWNTTGDACLLPSKKDTDITPSRSPSDLDLCLQAAESAPFQSPTPASYTIVNTIMGTASYLLTAVPSIPRDLSPPATLNSQEHSFSVATEMAREQKTNPCYDSATMAGVSSKANLLVSHV